MQPAPAPDHPWAVRHPGNRRGFTLLELMVVLAIITVLLGVAVMSFDHIGTEGTVRQPVLDFQKMTQEAMRRASLQEAPQVIAFHSKGFSLHYRPQSTSGIATTATSLSDSKATTPAQRQVTLSTGIRMSLRRFGSDKFLPAAGQRLIVSPGGICEPLTARFEYESSWIEVTLDPLSGLVSDEAMHIQ